MVGPLRLHLADLTEEAGRDVLDPDGGFSEPSRPVDWRA